MAGRKRSSIRDAKFRNRPSHVPIPVEHRPEILFVCHSGVLAETFITILKCAEYSITHVETKNEAVNWLLRRSFQVVILDCLVNESEELQARAGLLALPVITMTTHPPHTDSGVTAAGVRELLTTLFTLAPLEWAKQRRKPLVC